MAAVALAAAMAGKGCRVDDDSPEGVARAFTAAARAGDRDAVFDLLGPETRKRLGEAAKRATALVGGSRRFDPLDLVGVSKPGETAAPQAFELVSRDGDKAVVDIVTADDEHHPLSLVKVGGKWKVEVPAYQPSPP